MRKLLAVGGAAALALWAMAASADEITGTISNIDLTRNTFQLEGKTYTASPSNTVGDKLSELKEGDKVRVNSADDTTGKSRTTPCRSRRSSRASLIGKAFGLLSGAVRTPSRSDRRLPRLFEGELGLESGRRAGPRRDVGSTSASCISTRRAGRRNSTCGSSSLSAR